MTIFYCVLARVAPSKSLENDLQQLQMSNFFLRLRRAIFFTITYSVIWTQSRAKTTAVYLHQWYRHRVLTVIRYFWSQRRAETTLLHLHEWYMRRMLIANGYMCAFPAFPRLYRHNMRFIMQLTCTYGYTNDYLCRK